MAIVGIASPSARAATRHIHKNPLGQAFWQRIIKADDMALDPGDAHAGEPWLKTSKTPSIAITGDQPSVRRQRCQRQGLAARTGAIVDDTMGLRRLA